MIIPTSSRIGRLLLLLPLAFTVVLSLEGDDGQRRNHHTAGTLLYEGPLVHDQDWTIKSGPVGPDNQKT